MISQYPNFRIFIFYDFIEALQFLSEEGDFILIFGYLPIGVSWLLKPPSGFFELVASDFKLVVEFSDLARWESKIFLGGLDLFT